MIQPLIWIVDRLVMLLSLLIIVQVLVSYFVSPYHPARMTLDRLVNPLLAPIRKVLPQAGPFDFSPLVLLLIIQIAGIILTRVLLLLSF
jgi:YggT family protein